MGYKEEVAARLYEAFDEMRAAASKKRRSFGQKELAEKIGELLKTEPPNQSVVSRWMAQEEPSLPDNPTLDAAAQVLGVNELWLLLGKGPKHGEPPEGGSPSETGIDSDTTENFVPDPRSAQKRRRGSG